MPSFIITMPTAPNTTVDLWDVLTGASTPTGLSISPGTVPALSRSCRFIEIRNDDGNTPGTKIYYSDDSGMNSATPTRYGGKLEIGEKFNDSTQNNNGVPIKSFYLSETTGGQKIVVMVRFH